MTTNRWHLHRAGLINFWYYDEQEFHFSKGRLLLKGDNGAGKSVTMQSLLPLLLDGRKSPDRLDPFGSRARKIEDYLLGEKSLDMPDERTGYLYLEFKKEGLERYQTIGLGLKGKRGQTPDSWGFAIKDNRRVGHDFFLYKEDVNQEKIPLSRRQLENRLETGGLVVRGQEEYKKMVNQLLFGFENIENYDELIKLLIQLRTPKLSKDFKPTVIYEIMNGSLPPLSDEDLRPLTETIENMDTIKEQLETLETQLQSSESLEQVYDQYNRCILFEKADEYLKTMKRHGVEEAEIRGLESGMLQREESLQNRIEEQQQVRSEFINAKQLKEDLDENDAVKAEKTIYKLEQEQTSGQQNLQKWQKRLDDKEDEERKLRSQLREKQGTIESLRNKLLAEVQLLDELALEAYFEMHSLVRDEFMADIDQYAIFDSWKNDLSRHIADLDQVLKVVRQVEKARELQIDRKRELGELKAQLEEAERVLARAERLLLEEKDNFVERVLEWQKGNRILTQMPEAVQKLAHDLQEYPEEYDYHALREPIRQIFLEREGQILQEQRSLEHQKGLQEEKLAEVRQEWEKWQATTDPEPERHPKSQQTREYLQEQGIPYVPFFAAVEFRQGVSEEEKGRIESALQEMGLLDALILPEKYEQGDLLRTEGFADSVIQRNPQIMRSTLLDYLEPALGEGAMVQPADVDSILRSILIDTDAGENTYLDVDGSYGIGLLQGRLSSEERSIFIGREARRRYRQEMLEQLSAEQQMLREGLQQIQSKIQSCVEGLATLQTEWNYFPKEDDLATAYKLVLEGHRDCVALEKQVEQKDRLWKEALQKYQTLNNQLQVLLAGKKYPESALELEEVLDAAREYQDHLYQLTNFYQRYQNEMENQQRLHEQLENISVDLDDLRVDLRGAKYKLEGIGQRLRELREFLQQTEIEELKRHYRECLVKVEELPERIADLQGEIQGLRTELARDEKDLQLKGEQLATVEGLKNRWEQVFIDEIDLNYYSLEDELSELNPQKLAEKVRNDLQSWVQKQQVERSKVEAKLQQIFYSETSVLMDYRIQMLEIFQVESPTGEVSTDWQRLMDLTSRWKVTIELEGRKVSPYALSEQLRFSIETKRSLLTESDRQLYEEILMQNVGQRIRSRIYRAQSWVKEMNQLMSERNTSSGLTLSLQWQPQVATNESEMNIKELVALLNRDSILLTEEDFHGVTEHFRSQIERARVNLNERGYGESLHQAIKEVLDYRRWFQFVLYYQKSGDRKRELTDHVFNQFSGGEKAMSMYIPLFSAVYSHYEQASPDSPRIITLDEAFAGVDENNIRDMFDLVEQLGFDFIMNSQALWGDYDTISHLTTAELVRPKNANYVSVFHYYWDGKVRSLLSDLDLEEEERCLA